MNTHTKTICLNHRSGPSSNGSEERGLVTTQEKWVQEYADRILTRFLRWQTPLDVAHTYTGKLKKDLAEFYDDPIKRMLIEASY